MGKYNISLAKIKEICEETEAVGKIGSLQELKDFFSYKTSKGLWLKDIMLEAGVPEGEIPPEKEKRINWIIKNIHVEGFSDHVPEMPEPQGEEKIPEKQGQVCKDCQLTRDDVNRFIGRLKPECFQDAEGQLDIRRITLHEGLPVKFQDEFLVQYRPGFYEGLVAILKKNQNEVAAIGYLQRGQKDYHIILDKEKIDYSAFGSNRKYRLALFREETASLFEKGSLETSDEIEFKSVISLLGCNIDYKPMDISKNTLCIDFGTSNTSAGTYGIMDEKKNGIELVSFTDVTSADMKEAKLYPTMVYVEDCSDPQHVRYLFGYDAKKAVMDRGYDTEASVFFEIKRWISSLDAVEEIGDEEGNWASVERRAIVKAYILHVIELAQQYFKVKFRQLHLSAPVKLKEKFYAEMSTILKEEGYTVLPTGSSVDEGIAIIYNSVSKLVAQRKIHEDKKTSIMILDCGGGTTDLASCEVSAKKLDVGIKLEITAKFVNGNSNFGGNNITYRIMQLLKIKLASEFSPEKMGECGVKALIPKEESEILSEVENAYKESSGEQYNSDANSKIYAKFQEAYEMAEEVIPTKFSESSVFKFEKQLKKIKRNYFYLWQLAEKIKIKFYEEDVVSVDFETSKNKPLEFDKIENYYLYAAENGNLVKKENPADQVEITINEIRRVLCGDIYGLLNGMLAQEELKVNDYAYYRLAGQSCKINLFMELLKEFIPGRNLRMNSVIRQEEAEEEKGSIKLKLDCIKGSIAYVRDKECGKIKPEIETDEPKLIYDIYVNKVDVEKQVLSKDDPSMLEYEAYSDKATKVEFLVKDSYGGTERRIIVNWDKSEPEKIDLSKLFEEIRSEGVISEKALSQLQDEIIAENPRDSDENEHVRIVFAVPSKAGYGMTVYRIIKKKDGDKAFYGWWKPLYENFEDESTKTFFDGRR